VSTDSSVADARVVAAPGDELPRREGNIQAKLGDWHALAEEITELALRAFQTQAWKVLGYDTWKEYAGARFTTVALPRETTKQINAALVNEGNMSARSAAAVSGTDDKTASSDAKKSRAEDSAPVRRTTGADGKEYPASKPRKKRAPVQPEPADEPKIAWSSKVIGHVPTTENLGEQPDPQVPYQRAVLCSDAYRHAIVCLKWTNQWLSKTAGARPTPEQFEVIEGCMREIIEHMAAHEAAEAAAA
jgi:hypothetical protein